MEWGGRSKRQAVQSREQPTQGRVLRFTLISAHSLLDLDLMHLSSSLHREV